jgi:hypothetical protein
LCALVVGTAALGAVDSSFAWASLTVAQQQALAPLQRDWPTIEPNRRAKWLELAARFHKMPADERARVQQRMAEWARLTPAERTSARMQFQEVRNVPQQERQAKWQAYQALSEDERKSLAQRAKPAAHAGSAADPAALKASAPDGGTARRPATPAPQARAVAPIVVQAKPGATTSTMSTRVPPGRRDAGAPRIAATSSYVDPATLLPRPRATQPAVAVPAASAAAVK